MKFEPSYIKLIKSGELGEKIEGLYKILESCELCPRKCKVNRLKREKGYCRAGSDLAISSYGPHFGDRYGIADSVFRTLTANSVPILAAGCSGSAVYLVLPQGRAQDARQFLSEAFEVPPKTDTAGDSQ